MLASTHAFFFSMGLRLGSVLGSGRFGRPQKWGQPSENFVADRGSFASRFCDALA